MTQTSQNDLKRSEPIAQTGVIHRHNIPPENTKRSVKTTSYRKSLSLMPSYLQQKTALAFSVVLVAVIIFVATFQQNSFDNFMLNWFIGERSGLATTFMLALTNAFTPSKMVIYALIAAVVAGLWQRSVKLGLAVLGAVGFSSALAQILKRLIGRHRPDLSYQLVHETDLSFPSGHATGIAALTATLYLAVYCVGRSSARRWSRLVTALTGVCLAVLAGLVCLSRLYVSAHWCSDVLAGALLGVCFSVFWFWVTEQIWSRKPWGLMKR